MLPPEPVAAVNGRLVPLREACLSILDAGVVQGAIVTERIRTFAHRPYLLAEHLDRLRSSLEETGVAAPTLVDQLLPLVAKVVSHNAPFIDDWQDLAIVIFITPGLPPAGNHTSGSGHQPTLCVHTVPIPPPQWGVLAAEGVRLVTPSVRQPPAETIAPQIKHRSRLHWFLAEREARQVDPRAMALLLDAQGFVTETSSGNLMIYDGRRLLTPRPEQVLRGISQQVVTELAAERGIETVAADLTPSDVRHATEAFVVSTGYCLLSVTRINGRAIGNGRPGPLSQHLLQCWSAAVGVDIRDQQHQAARNDTTT